jgi:hypothetical protein
MKCGFIMGKYYSYEGKQVGFVRKMIDQVVLIEPAWTNEVNSYLAKNGYDTLLNTVAQILKRGGHPAITRAQAWMILHDLTNKGCPEILQNVEADEVATKGNLFAETIKGAAVGAATVVDGAVSGTQKVVGGAVMGISAAASKVAKPLTKDDEAETSDDDS